MKALSLKQPWATMIADGAKTIETRTWTTAYRGPLLIVASKKPRLPDQACGESVALCRLVDCRAMTPRDVLHACCPFEEGRKSWCLKDVIKTPWLKIHGQLGLYEVNEDDFWYEMKRLGWRDPR